MIRIWINNVELDLSEDVVFPLTYSQADAKNPEGRKRSSSKTIVMPGTQVNNAFFSSAYDLNISDVYGDLVGFDFDPTLRYPCVVTRNGKPIFKGSSHLTKVVTKKDVTNGRINAFTVILYSELADIFQALGDLKVSELGWSDYDHTLTIANIQASWVAATGSSYWYPLIDFGFTSNPLSYLTNQLRPYVYVKEIVEKCLAVGGYTLSSAFFSTTLIKKLTWGYGGGDPILLSSAEVTARQANYTGDGTATYNLPLQYYNSVLDQSQFFYNRVIPISDNSIITMTLVADSLTQYDEPTGEIVIAHAGYYNLALTGTFPLTYAYSAALSNEHYFLVFKLRTFVNGALINTEQVVVTDTASGSDTVVFNKTLELDVSTGDIVYNDIQISTFGSFVNDNATGKTLDVVLDLNNTLDMDLTAINSGLVDGDTVQLSRFLPEMKAVDLLKDVITMFNLYIADPDEDGVILIEPQDAYFYGTDDVDQWSDKLARDSDIEIQPAANIEGKTYRFRFAEDRDYYKQLYFDVYGFDYGDYNYDVPSTFKKGEKVYQLKIAQSCPVELEGTDIIIPRILKLDEGTQATSPHKGKPRMFFNNGAISSDSWNLVNSDTGAITVNTTYPQAHHIDNLTTAGFDLNFGRPEVVFYTATTYTTDNLFYRHHAQFIRELTGRDSKIVNAWFRLKETDFYENFMRRLCVIDGVAYRKNLVKDWIANSSKLVKVELIKIVAGNSRANFTYTALPQSFEPVMDETGDGTPITADVTVKSYRSFYPMDTSAKDLDVTLTGQREGLPSSGIRAGKAFTIQKVSKGGKITLSTTGGATIAIAGKTPSSTLIITGYNDSVTLVYENAGGNFKVI